MTVSSRGELATFAAPGLHSFHEPLLLLLSLAPLPLLPLPFLSIPLLIPIPPSEVGPFNTARDLGSAVSSRNGVWGRAPSEETEFGAL